GITADGTATTDGDDVHDCHPSKQAVESKSINVSATRMGGLNALNSSFITHHSSLITQSLSLENLQHTFLNPCLPGLGLFGRRKIKEVSSLPSRCQCLKRQFLGQVLHPVYFGILRESRILTSFYKSLSSRLFPLQWLL